MVPENPRMCVGIIHGYAEHSGRYKHVQEAWADKGIATVAIDLRGHGRADGKRGHCSRFEEYLDDAGELERLVRDRSETCFLFGHSFGGLVASRSAIANPAPWKGLVLSSPFFAVGMKVPALKRAAGKVADVLLPSLAMPSGIPTSGLTHDVDKVRAYENDPLVFSTITPRFFNEAERAQRAALASAKALELPLYEFFGEKDPVASFAAGKAFFDAAGSEDKTFVSLPELLHETLNEPGWRPIADAAADWILTHS
jgi:alpha-beta hydrolase superfamily lysophospholipase